MTIKIALRHLEAFLAVARTRSFSAGAKQIHVSQPALSATVRQFEEAIGARLFDRDTRNIALTPVGTEVLGFADRLLKDFEGAFAGVRALVEGKRGRLAIAASPSLAAGFLPEVLAAFQRGHPGIQLQVHDALSDVAIEMVRSGTVDLALVPEKYADRDLKHQDLFRDHLVLLCTLDHPLAKLRSVTWRELLPYPVVAFTGASSLRHLVEVAFSKQGSALRPAFEVTHASTFISFVAHGLGVGVLSYSMVPLARAAGLVHRRITRPEIHRLLCVVSLKSRSPTPAAQAFVEACVRYASAARDTGDA